MYQIYENFIVWLLLWTPWDNGLRFNLEDGLDQSLEDFFWEAIAPNQDSEHPCSRPLTEEERDTMESLLWEHYHADPEEFA